MITNMLFAASLLMVAPAHADFVVDTGVPAGPQALLFDAGNAFAGQFSLAAATHVRAISGWLNDLGQGGTFTVALYADADKLPSAVLDDAQATFTTPTGEPGWNGARHLDWLLAAGTYWVAFQVDVLKGDSFSGSAPVQAPQPLLRYAFDDGSGYHTVAGFAPGVQIEPVPLPGSFALLGGGLLGVTVLRARRKARVEP